MTPSYQSNMMLAGIEFHHNKFQEKSHEPKFKKNSSQRHFFGWRP
jgi:hypothetical protein